VGENPNATEDLGYAFVQKVVAQSGAIWRRQAEKDIGIDGLIEIQRRDGASAYVAVQVKTGKSYFARESEGAVSVYLGRSLGRLNRMLTHTIIVLVHPAEEFACWESVQGYVAEYRDALDKGSINVPLGKIFDKRAIEVLRQDARTIMTPRFSSAELQQLIFLNRAMTLGAFIQLANSTFNRMAYRVTESSDHKLLQEEGLITILEDRELGACYWIPTEKGEHYVQLLLGDRYVMAGRALCPKLESGEDGAYACKWLEFHFAEAGKPPARKPLWHNKPSNPADQADS
jgi:hypothetical protein